jgi:hypothetical protein
MQRFLHCNNNIGIRKPGERNFSGLTSFNKHNMKVYLENLKTIMDLELQLMVHEFSAYMELVQPQCKS